MKRRRSGSRVPDSGYSQKLSSHRSLRTRRSPYPEGIRKKGCDTDEQRHIVCPDRAFEQFAGAMGAAETRLPHSDGDPHQGGGVRRGNEEGRGLDTTAAKRHSFFQGPLLPGNRVRQKTERVRAAVVLRSCMTGRGGGNAAVHPETTRGGRSR